MARNQHTHEAAANPPEAAEASVLGQSEAPVQQTPTGPPPATSDARHTEAQTAAILTAVEQQLTRYFTAMAARTDAVQQASEASRTELINHFQAQIEVLYAELERSRAANAEYEAALQAAVQDRLTDLADAQHTRFSEVENRLGRLDQELIVELPRRLQEATTPLHERLEQASGQLSGRIDEIHTAVRRFDEQSGALVQHVNATTSALEQRLDESHRLISQELDQRTAALGEQFEKSTASLGQQVAVVLDGMRTEMSDQVTSFTRKLDENDKGTVERMITLEQRVNNETANRVAAAEATMGRISNGIDQAIAAISQRVISLENTSLLHKDRLDEIAVKVETVDEAAIDELRTQLSSSIGEAMLVRIELERVSNTTGEHIDKINARIGELAAQIVDTELDVSTAIQLERLEEIERALTELDPDQFVRKTERTSGSTPASSHTSASHTSASHTSASHTSDPFQQPTFSDPSESTLSSW